LYTRARRVLKVCFMFATVYRLRTAQLSVNVGLTAHLHVAYRAMALPNLRWLTAALYVAPFCFVACEVSSYM